MVGELKTAAKLHKHPLKSAGFKVLKAPDVPSVLIELGYVSNKQDLKLMTSEAWRARTSDAVAQAVNTFFSTRLAGSGPGHAVRTEGDVAVQAAASARSGSASLSLTIKPARLSLLPAC